ncbi:DNA mismatch repair protein MutS [Ilyomonas limi]|uniref:DNA mismatch repair protein MutS n=1 Tax=Ilyomonas limi TaxID=2575867 RepID=A0A4U3L8X5_9BACT|nr:DNA mismatch repair protein MutS [Ilyomonas limi]TKK70924.1 DNA mismatch repair protein MutS [Ilyomonas limi]
MQVDKTTVNDLSIFNADETLSVFHRLDFTTTVGGKDWLRILLAKPYDNLKQIEDVQQMLQSLLPLLDNFPTTISNGTIMVIERFYETPLDEMPAHANTVNSISYKIFHSADFSLTRYSVEHFINFFKGLNSVAELCANAGSSILINMSTRIASLIAKPVVRQMVAWDKTKKLPYPLILHFGNFMRRQYKPEALELVNIYTKLDAYCSMAKACKQYHFCIPRFKESSQPCMQAVQLYHPLLTTPVAYDVQLTPQQNFLFMTGANMAGKSTFIKAIGVSVYLAHVGMGVPAQSMQLSLFDGLLSNIQVVDNIVQGESYFFNEVQRIRKTIQQISDGRKWLILIDELFKGTNVQDAMKCSTVVIEGLRKMHNALFILSTHLYEIGHTLKQYDNIQFRYFETEVKDDQLLFSYHLKEGISNDRLGYLILKREGVVDMLNKIPDTLPEVEKGV